MTLRRPKPLTAAETLESLRAIAAESGAGSAGRRASLVAGLLRRAGPRETRYLARALVKNMRVGANRTSVLSALAVAAEEFQRETETDGGGNGRGGDGGGDPDVVSGDVVESTRARAATSRDAASAKTSKARAARAAARAASNAAAGAAVQRAYSLCPSLETIVLALVEGGVAGVVRAGRMRPGTPVRADRQRASPPAPRTPRPRALGGPGGGRGGGGAGRRDPRNGVGTERDTPVEPSGNSRAGGIGEIGLDGASRTDPRRPRRESVAVPSDGASVTDRRTYELSAKFPRRTTPRRRPRPPRTRRSSPNTNTTAFARRFISCRLMVRVRARRARLGRGARFGRSALPPGWRVAIFSRNCEDRTAAFPDVVEAFVDVALGGVVSAATRDSSWTPRSSASTARRGNSARFKIYRRDRDPSARKSRAPGLPRVPEWTRARSCSTCFTRARSTRTTRAGFEPTT